MTLSSELISAIERNAFSKASPAVQVLIDEILARHGQAALGILFYGSCLRSGDDLDGLVDLYLLVDSYRNAYSGRVPALLVRGGVDFLSTRSAGIFTVPPSMGSVSPGVVLLESARATSSAG